MSSFNKVILMGNFVRDPETRTTTTGFSIAKFSLAVNRKFTTQTGESREEVSYIDVNSLGKQAETIAQYFSKGKPILVEGRLQQNRWENAQGEKRNKLVVVLERFSFVGRKDDFSNPPADTYTPPPKTQGNPTDPPDADIPF